MYRQQGYNDDGGDDDNDDDDKLLCVPLDLLYR